ncbi:uncharacterized protein LOC130262739 isoform X4 [Oenanthe melanoleuca]|uniref:uncharacterized protein LOC130262739 isoform X4 n=1 Tax=Oenanthe melanoleuca TaxID=2939378 RepID=UPI0024C1977B|nr:uncharacterized protein LOC130262739 isoform X4 [Oenanthe melanoleuca]
MERGPAEEPLPAAPARGGRPPAPECVRRQKRRELDARRSKCRIRIGGHLERWCRLKEQLGFALHSQLAQFLLDRYSSHGCTWSPGELERLQPAALQRLVVLSHSHSQECGFVPDMQLPAPGSSAAPLVWECVAGHRFSWGGAGAPGSPSPEPPGRSPSPGAGRRHSPRGAAPPSGEEGAAGSAHGDGEQLGRGGDSSGTAPQVPLDPGPVAAACESSAIPGDHVEPAAEPQEEEEEEEDEDFAEGDDLAYTDDLRDENYHPCLGSSEPQRRQSQPKARKKPVKEEQPLPSSGPSEEKSVRGFMGLVSPTLSLVGLVQGGQGTRRASQDWGCHGGGQRALEPDPWWAVKPPPGWRWNSPKSINPTTISSTNGSAPSPAALGPWSPFQAYKIQCFVPKTAQISPQGFTGALQKHLRDTGLGLAPCMASDPTHLDTSPGWSFLHFCYNKGVKSLFPGMSHNSSVCHPLQDGLSASPIPNLSPAAPEPPQMQLEQEPPFLQTQSQGSKSKMGDKNLAYEQSRTFQMSKGFSSSPFPRATGRNSCCFQGAVDEL